MKVVVSFSLHHKALRCLSNLLHLTLQQQQQCPLQVDSPQMNWHLKCLNQKRGHRVQGTTKETHHKGHQMFPAGPRPKRRWPHPQPGLPNIGPLCEGTHQDNERWCGQGKLKRNSQHSHNWRRAVHLGPWHHGRWQWQQSQRSASPRRIGCLNTARLGRNGPELRCHFGCPPGQ